MDLNVVKAESQNLKKIQSSLLKWEIKENPLAPLDSSQNEILYKITQLLAADSGKVSLKFAVKSSSSNFVCVSRNPVLILYLKTIQITVSARRALVLLHCASSQPKNFSPGTIKSMIKLIWSNLMTYTWNITSSWKREPKSVIRF